MKANCSCGRLLFPIGLEVRRRRSTFSWSSRLQNFREISILNEYWIGMHTKISSNLMKMKQDSRTCLKLPHLYVWSHLWQSTRHRPCELNNLALQLCMRVCHAFYSHILNKIRDGCISLHWKRLQFHVILANKRAWKTLYTRMATKKLKSPQYRAVPPFSTGESISISSHRIHTT